VVVSEVSPKDEESRTIMEAILALLKTLLSSLSAA